MCIMRIIRVHDWPTQVHVNWMRAADWPMLAQVNRTLTVDWSGSNLDRKDRERKWSTENGDTASRVCRVQAIKRIKQKEEWKRQIIPNRAELNLKQRDKGTWAVYEQVNRASLPGELQYSFCFVPARESGRDGDLSSSRDQRLELGKKDNRENCV